MKSKNKKTPGNKKEGKSWNKIRRNVYKMC